MKYRKLVLFSAVLLGLTGCATNQTASKPPESIWLDHDYAYQRTRVTETRDTLFALDAVVRENLATAERLDVSTKRRLDHLISRLYGPKGIRLAYNAGQTTGASETWRNRRGDCLSLTILAYAAARSLGLDAHMQEVRVPMAVDRRDGIDFINGHVNLFIRNDTDIVVSGQSIRAGGFVIDFEPQAGTRGTGTWLTEDAILARYYNNRASEYLVQQDFHQAYAYYKAAIETDPGYVPSYSNLALLYIRGGYRANAEQLFLHAIVKGGPSYAALRSLQQLMTAQGRHTEAQRYAELLQRRQDEDPYHWFDMGLVELKAGRYTPAIRALERAATLATGFEEIHYNLGLAYWRNGQREAASKQLSALRAINNQDPGLALLSKKMQEKTQQEMPGLAPS